MSDTLKGYILAGKAKLRREPAAPAPELGELPAGRALYIRELTSLERDAFESSRATTERVGDKTVVRPQNANLRARLLVLALCDDEGKRLFDDKEAPALGQLPGVVTDRWFEQAQRLTWPEPALEGDAKNSSPEGAAGASSASPPSSGDPT